MPPIDLTPDELRHLAVTCVCADELTDERERLERLAKEFKVIAGLPLRGAARWSVPLSKKDARLLLKVCRARLVWATEHQREMIEDSVQLAAPKQALLTQGALHMETLRRQIAEIEVHLARPVARMVRPVR